jgi:hypothetical protein
MRALTLYQPWAWLAVCGFEVCPELQKDIENRSYPTNYRGRLLIHASLRIDARAYNDAFVLVERAFGRAIACRMPQFSRAQALPRGGIIGAVTVVDVRPPTASAESPWHMPGYFGWVLRDPIRLPFYPVRGQQSLFGNFAIRGGVVRTAC